MKGRVLLSLSASTALAACLAQAEATAPTPSLSAPSAPTYGQPGPVSSQAPSAPAVTPVSPSAPVDKTVVTFSNIVDGQPGGPGQIGLEGIASLGGGDWQAQSTLQFTGKGGFLRNALFAVTFPTVQGGEGIRDVEISVSVSWQQRWIGSNQSRTNFATLLAVQIPVNEPNQDTDITLAGSLAQVVGTADVFYLNGYVETNRGPNPQPTEWGVFTGYKHPLNDTVSLIGDVGWQSSGDVASAGLALQVNVSGHLTLGPGINLSTTLDRRNSVEATGGLVVYYGF